MAQVTSHPSPDIECGARIEPIEHNRPQHAPANTRPRLVLTVDTEEEGLWGGEFRTTGNTVENIQGIPRFQALCDELEIRPTYLVDAPVVEDDRASSILAEIHADGRCEIGAHLHSWCTPPFDERYDRSESYQCNLPEELQRSKLEWLTNALTERFGSRPVSFRSGRYGLDTKGARILADLGYRVDSSVIPFTDYTEQGGPDFREAPWQPYHAAQADLLSASDEDGLLEAPVSIGFNRGQFPTAMRIQQSLRRAPWRWLKLEGILDELRLLRRIKFSPEQAGVRDLRVLADRYCESPGAVLVMMFHSSSLVPGHSPYVGSREQLQEFLRRIAQTCRYGKERYSMDCVTLGELARGSDSRAD